MISKIQSTFVFQQWLAGIGAAMLLIQLGFMIGWTSPAIVRLTGPESEIPLNTSQASWVVSLVNLGRLFGAVLGAAVASYLGSKRAIIVTLIPIAIGWTVIGMADRVEWLYVARLAKGTGLGMTYSVFPLYIGEISMPEIRGALVSLAMLGAPFGMFISSIAGSYLALPTSSFIYLGMCILLMGLFLLLPNSPHYLIKIGEREAARKSINWYRAGRGVDEEFNAVEKFVTSRGSQGAAEILEEFKKPAIKKATLQIVIIFTFVQISGANSILFYMEKILSLADFKLITPSDLVIYVNIFSICAAVSSIILIDRCGRKFLLLMSSTGIIMAMIGLMMYFWARGTNRDLSNIQWLPTASMLVFVIAFFGGLLQVPSTILSETFPSNIKCWASCIASLTGAATSFLSAKTYQPMVDLVGEKYVFLAHAIFAFLIIPYTIFFVKETKGKSLQQIQDELMPK